MEKFAAEFEKRFGAGRTLTFISAPGRTELGGNHTDHQRGAVLAAAVDLDVFCAVSPNGGRVIRVASEGHKPDAIELDDLSPRPDERGHGGALIRGVAAWFQQNGCRTGGLDAYTASRIPSGSGLSSSAAFEVAVGNMLNHLFNGGAVRPEHIAMAGQYAENEYFGKPSGLMDQMASSVGGCVMIDFADPEKPAVTRLHFDPGAHGYTLCVVDTGGSHADLTAEYAAVTEEMRAVAACFGKRYLSQVDGESFFVEIPRLRVKTGDRAVLRALHFFGENARVKKQAAALARGDFPVFLELVNESGQSSQNCLQNSYAHPREQGITLALALSARLLAGAGGAWRVHGGGFAGTIQAYVPHDTLPGYRAGMDGVFGAGACRELRIRPRGGCAVRNLPNNVTTNA